jgi:cell division protein FtsN
MRNYYNRQQGGTVLGIIIGLVIGLGIALAVALAITKTPMPFTNKMGKPEKAPGANASQISDPNKPLYGNRTPAKEAARDFAKPVPSNAPAQAADTAPDGKPAVVDLSPPPNTAKKPDAKAAEIKISDGKDDKAAAKTDNPDDKWSYYLQAGAVREQTDAENTRAKLALMGVEARISERLSENGTLYRVRVGPFGQLEAMNRVRGKLSDNGVDVAVVRISK